MTSIPIIAHTTKENFLKGAFFLVFFWKINFGKTIQMNKPIITFTTINVISYSIKRGIVRKKTIPLIEKLVTERYRLDTFD